MAATDPLAGLWSKHDSMSEGDPVRFWYFHGGKPGPDGALVGHGLFRYGRIGYANTHSFDYRLEGEVLDLTFRKTGESHALRVQIEGEGGARQLRLVGDPRDPGAVYHFARGPLAVDAHGEASKVEAPEMLVAAPFADRVWIDFQPYATGGAGFSMYQFEPAAIDGRGVGWFHEGDFDQWRTEALSYRVDGDRVELFFELGQELGITSFAIGADDRGRVLRFDEDPRDFWLTHEYRDAGRGFSSPAFTPVVATGELFSAR